MPLSESSPERRRAALPLAACLLAVFLGAGFTSEADARKADAVQNAPGPVLMPKSPCPEGVTLETWEDAPTLWRLAYARCKPEGAPARREFDMDDAADFIRRIGVRYPDLGDFKDVSFYDCDGGTFRVGVSLAADPSTTDQAETVAADVLRKFLLYLENNGYDPVREKLKVTARVQAGALWKKFLVFAIFDNETGGIRYKTLRRSTF